MDADGSFKNYIAYTSASEQFVKEFQNYLASVNISSKVRRININASSLYIPVEFKVDFLKQIGVINVKKEKDYQKLLQSKTIFYEYQSINML